MKSWVSIREIVFVTKTFPGRKNGSLDGSIDKLYQIVKKEIIAVLPNSPLQNGEL